MANYGPKMLGRYRQILCAVSFSCFVYGQGEESRQEQGYGHFRSCHYISRIKQKSAHNQKNGS